MVIPKALVIRQLKRKTVTILAGFKSHEGIVICADSQETVDYAKRKVSKVRIEPEYRSTKDILNKTELSAAFCGSGEGPFIDKLIEECWQAARSCTDLDEACGLIESKIKDFYREYGEIYQTGGCPLVELIYGVTVCGQSKLFLASGPIVLEKDGYDSSGVGRYMAEYLAGKMYRTGLSLFQCVILAAYILIQAKDHVDGCGGDSHIAVLAHDVRQRGRVNQARVEALTQLLANADQNVGKLLIETADLTKDDAAFAKAVENYQRNSMWDREAFQNRLKRDDLSWNSFMRILGGKDNKELQFDLLGFLMDRSSD